MSNVPVVNTGTEYLRNTKNAPIDKNQKNAQKPSSKNGLVKDVIDDNLKNAIKRENMIASEHTINNVAEANQILSDILSRIENTPSANKFHTNINSNRVNALVNL